MLSMLGKNSADDILNLFPPGNKVWHFVQIVPSGDNLHKMSNIFLWKIRRQFVWNVKPYFLEKIRIRKNITIFRYIFFKYLSVEFAQRVLSLSYFKGVY